MIGIMKKLRTAPYLLILSLAAVMGLVFGLRHIPFYDHQVAEIFFTRTTSTEFPQGHWLWPKSDPILTFWLHTFIRNCFIALAVGCIGVALFSIINPKLKSYRYPAIMIVLALIVVPATVAVIKDHSDRFCPSKLSLYDGQVSDDYSRPVTGPVKAHCFPAAHPAPGFALMILGAIATTRRRRMIGYAIGLGAGTFLSLIQFARGEHFLSHCLATALIAAWLVNVLAVTGKAIRERRS